MSTFTRHVVVAALAPALLLGVVACSPTVPMTPAQDATNPLCADVIVRLRTVPAIDGFERRTTDAQATAAWGTPSAILLRCGVPVPGPSTLLCATVKGVDWLRDDSQAPNYIFTTYGRDPAVEVIVNGDVASGTEALIAVSNAVGSIPATRACTNPDNVLKVPEPLPTPSLGP
ncbi:MAG: CRISPR-associated protein Cas5 [Microbacteriaceae bacterium]|nr:CRISPR-associated protein Cas5 [Microbacteriaceae bacterium]